MTDLDPAARPASDDRRPTDADESGRPGDGDESGRPDVGGGSDRPVATDGAGRPVVAVTMGDPAGVGPEVIVTAYPDLLADARVLVVGDSDVLRAAVDVCGVDLDVRPVEEVDDASYEPGTVGVFDLGAVDAGALERGVVDGDYGAASLAYVERAIELATAGRVDAITTAPINKQSTARAGSTYAGHTAMLADATGADRVAMMLLEGDLRVTHVSTHVPLREACDLVTTDSVLDAVELTDAALGDLGVDDPTVAVAGLNPHAGDGGVLGDEEAAAIRPAVERARAAGVDAVGPASPDAVFAAAARGQYDAVVAMYHDQGHIPVKLLGAVEGGGVSGVNVTLGLPVVRTSVDHGTAFDIAGEGVADPTSLREAVAVAARLVRARRSGRAGR